MAQKSIVGAAETSVNAMCARTPHSPAAAHHGSLEAPAPR